VVIALSTRTERPVDTSWYLEQCGSALYVYAKDHGGVMPAKLSILLDNGSLNDKAARYIRDNVQYRGSAIRLTSLARDTIIAEDSRVDSSGCESVLLADGNVVAVQSAELAANSMAIGVNYRVKNANGKFVIQLASTEPSAGESRSWK
jgi:hypothetical protein